MDIKNNHDHMLTFYKIAVNEHGFIVKLWELYI